MKKTDFLDLSKKKLDNKIFLIPTDTIYGFSALWKSNKAIEKIKKIKKRDKKKGFIILIYSIEQLNDFDVLISKEQINILNKIWPGKVSVVLKIKKNKEKYKNISGNFNSLVFRIPNYVSLRNFIKKVGPIISTSANISNFENIKKPSELNDGMKKEIDYYIDIGILDNKSSSMIEFIR